MASVQHKVLGEVQRCNTLCTIEYCIDNSKKTEGNPIATKEKPMHYIIINTACTSSKAALDRGLALIVKNKIYGLVVCMHGQSTRSKLVAVYEALSYATCRLEQLGKTCCS